MPNPNSPASALGTETRPIWNILDWAEQAGSVFLRAEGQAAIQEARHVLTTLESALATAVEERETYRRAWNRSDEQLATATARVKTLADALENLGGEALSAAITLREDGRLQTALDLEDAVDAAHHPKEQP